VTGTIVDRMTDPLLRPWRRQQHLAVLRLAVDIVNAHGFVVRPAGSLAFATWSHGREQIAEGWLIAELGFTCVLKEPDVVVLERP
jgi:hypothetical protein